MLNPNMLSDLIVSKLQAMPGVVVQMNGHAERITSYESSYPSALVYNEIVTKQAAPFITSVWMGSGSGNFKTGEAWVHRFTLICKTANKYADLFEMIVNDIPVDDSSDGLKFRLTRIHTSCDPICTLAAERRQFYPSEFSALDYFEISFTLVERGISA